MPRTHRGALSLKGQVPHLLWLAASSVLGRLGESGITTKGGGHTADRTSEEQCTLAGALSQLQE